MAQLVYLDYWRMTEQDRNKMLQVYDAQSSSMKLLKGSPLLISIEGTYVRADDLPNLCIKKEDKHIVNEWVSTAHRAGEVAHLKFRWRR